MLLFFLFNVWILIIIKRGQNFNIFCKKTPPGCSGALRVISNGDVSIPIFNITSLERSVPTMWAESGAGDIFLWGPGGTGRWHRILICGRVYDFSDHWTTSVHGHFLFGSTLFIFTIQLSMASLIYLFIIKCQEKVKIQK